METWLDRREWLKIKDKLPKGYKWEVQCATRKNKEKRAIGGMVIGIRKSVIMEIGEMEIVEEGLIAN